MTPESLTKSVLLYKAAATIAAEQADVIKGTNFYKQEVKYVINNASRVLDKELEKTYELFPDEEAQKIYFIAVNIIEKVVQILSSMQLEDVPVFEKRLDSYMKGDFVVLDENKFNEINK